MRLKFLILFLSICYFSFGQTSGNYNKSIVVKDSAWSLTGNAISSSTKFIGTTDNQRLVFKTNNVENATILANGKIGIKANTPTSTLFVNGSLGSNVTIITATYTATDNDNTIVCNNGATNITITLPNALTCVGRKYVLSRYAGSTGTITVVGTGSQIQALAGTVVATTTLGVHGATGQGLNFSFTAVNVAGVGVWVRL